MCIRYVFKYLCRHEETYWCNCTKATEEQRLLQEPCQSSNINYIPVIEKRQCCCSRECCQDDLDAKAQVVENAERELGIVTTGTDWKRLPGNRLKHQLIAAAKHHFLQCLSQYSVQAGYHLTFHGSWIKCKQSQHEPRPLRVPDRPEIRRLDRIDFLAAIYLWKKRPAVLADRNFHISKTLAEAAPQPVWLRGAMSEEKLNTVRVLLSDMIWEGGFTWQAGKNFQTLLDIQDHVVALQAIDPRPHLIDVEYVMLKQRYDALRTLMIDIRYWMDCGYADGKFSNTIHRDWSAVLKFIKPRLDRFIDAMDSWFQACPEGFQQSIKRLQDSPSAFQEALQFYLTQHGQPNKHPPQIGSLDSASRQLVMETRSAMTPPPAMVSSTNILYGSFVPFSAEPESIAFEMNGVPAVQGLNGQRKHRNKSSGSNWSSTSADRRPPLRKKGKRQRD